MPPINYIQSFHRLCTEEMMLEISKINLLKKISLNVPDRMRTLERQCAPRNSHIKRQNYRKPHISVVEPRY